MTEEVCPHIVAEGIPVRLLQVCTPLLLQYPSNIEQLPSAGVYRSLIGPESMMVINVDTSSKNQALGTVEFGELPK